jgi:uncharacterized membrane protein (DUF485 family)
MQAIYARAMSSGGQALTVLAAFALGTLVAELAGAENLGTAMAFGQIAFALALVWVLVRE